MVAGFQALLETHAVVSAQHCVLVMGNDPGDGFSQKSDIKRIRQRKTEGIHQIMARDAFQPRKHFPHEIEVRLAEGVLSGLMGVTVINAMIALENGPKRS